MELLEDCGNRKMDETTLLVLGASGHGKVAADIALKSKKYQKICFFDDAGLEQCLSFPVIGKCNEVFEYIGLHEIFVAIGNAGVRRKFIEALAGRGAEIATLIHPSAVIGEAVQIGMGSIVMAGAVLNPECKIGKGCIVNTCASVDHDCCLGDYVHVSVGAHVAGTVIIGDSTWIGAGAVVNNNLHITDSCMIGSGAVVVNNIEKKGTYVGVPARERNSPKTDANLIAEECMPMEENQTQAVWNLLGGVILWVRQFQIEKIAALLLLPLMALPLCERR